MTLHSIAPSSMIVMAGSPAIRIMQHPARHFTHHGRSQWTEEPAPRLRSHPTTIPKPQAISHESMMVADYGPQTPRLATAHFISASPTNG